MPKSDESPHLQELANQNVQIAAWCLFCGHHKLIPIEPLLTQINGHTPVIALARRLTCSHCGGRSIETRPHYASLDVVTGYRRRQD